ncbi:RNA-directed DNA polymerase, eukaryota, reverse transcriptase zinc-binding domain protein [Tanacetum coccineum]
MPTFGGGKSKTEDGKPVKVTSDLYVKVSIANVVISRTFVISNSSQIIGAVGVPVEQLVSGLVVKGTFPVLNKSGKSCKPGAVLTLLIQYVPMERVGQDLNFNGVLDTYFQLRRGGKVTLYQDAHVDDGYLPSMNLEGGFQCQNGNCWHDICEAIKHARRLIYITGWSVIHSVQLVRNGEGAKYSMLGGLLKANTSEQDPESWHVQVFRLIDSNSVKGFPKDPKEATSKVLSRLSRWKMKLLSIGGRLTLLKSVLGSMPIFHTSIFKVPSSILKSLESIRSRFFNGQDPKSNKASWVKWNKVLTPKDKGGLGVSSLFALNRGLMLKWVWRFYSQKCSLWTKVIKAIYGEDGNLNKDVSGGVRTCWTSIVHEVRVLQGRGINVADYIRLKLGNGENTRFWVDNWYEGGVIKELFPRMFALELNKNATVSSKLNASSLDNSFRRKARSGIEEMQLNSLAEISRMTTLVPCEDRYVWTLESDGVFSVASIRKEIDGNRFQDVSLPTRWVKSVPIKVNIIAWKVKSNALPTRFNISRRGMDIDSIVCPICNAGVESTNHIFFQCVVVRQIMRKISSWWNIDYSDVNSYEEWQVTEKEVRFDKLLQEAPKHVDQAYSARDPQNRQPFSDVVMMPFNGYERVNCSKVLKPQICVYCFVNHNVQYFILSGAASFVIKLNPGEFVEKTETNEPMSAPQDVVLRVQIRIIRAAPENKEQDPTGKIIVSSNQIGCVLSKGGAVISEMRKSTEAYIHILGKDQTSQYVARNEDVVQLIRSLPNEYVQSYLALRNAIVVLRFHPLKEFDEVKRSCRKCLACGNNGRSEKTIGPESITMNNGS